MTTYVVIGSNSFSGISYVNHLISSNKKVIALSRSSFKNVIKSDFKKIKNLTFYKFDINKDIHKLTKIFSKEKTSLLLLIMLLKVWWLKVGLILQIGIRQIF